MRELLAEHGQADAQPGEDGLGHGGSDGESVNKVVNPVTEDDHPGDRGDPLLLRLGLVHVGGVGEVGLAGAGDDGLHTVTVAGSGDRLVLSPGPGVHQDLEESLHHEEEINSAEDSEGDVEIVVVREHLLTIFSPSLSQTTISFSAVRGNITNTETGSAQLEGAVRRRCLKASGMRWKTEEEAREPTARPIRAVIRRG